VTVIGLTDISIVPIDAVRTPKKYTEGSAAVPVLLAPPVVIDTPGLYQGTAAIERVLLVLEGLVAFEALVSHLRFILRFFCLLILCHCFL